MATLKIENVHLRNGGNYIAVVKSKRKRSRDVYIDGELSKHLREFIEWKQKSVGTSAEPEAYLLTNRKG